MSELAISAKFTIHEIEIDFLRQFDPFRTQVRAAVHSCLFNMRNWMSSTYWVPPRVRPLPHRGMGRALHAALPE
jgi:hypothetical protein